MAVIDDIMTHVRAGRNFLLSGGAGSGKTHTLVGVIRSALEENPSKHIACITYTNAAADEINRRVNHPNVTVSTIHDFLWENIKHYQPQLKILLAQLVNDPDCPVQMRGVEHVEDNYFFGPDIERIDYKEYLQISKGIISHDEVIHLAKAMFQKNPKLCRLVSDRHPFILIDEYQDTQRGVIEILLEMLSPKDREEGVAYSIVGLFGDSMQSIYEDGVGDIDAYVVGEQAHVHEVKMEGNRRNPKVIIDLANKLRTDRIQQTPSDDVSAPNMLPDGTVKEGAIHFLYTLPGQDKDLNEVRRYIEDNYHWDFSDTKETKELDLTHNLIAGRGGFPHLIEIYDGDPILGYRDKVKKYIKDKNIAADFSDRTFAEVLEYLQTNYPEDNSKWQPSRGQQQDFIATHPDLFELAKSINYEVLSKMYVEKAQLIDDKKQSEEETGKKGTKRAVLIRHLVKLQQIIESYHERRIGDFFRLSSLPRIKVASDKSNINSAMQSLEGIDAMTIGDVIQLADAKGVLFIDDKLLSYKDANKYIYERVCALPFSEFRYLYDYLEGRTPYTTQHKTKGTEFNHVFVLMDNGRWSLYNYSHLMSGTPRGKSEGPRIRTNKLFYVCCTRAKEDLVMFYPQIQPADLEKAKEWFGKNNVIDI